MGKQDELFSWSWEFQPSRPEYQVSEAMTLQQALEVVTEWDVSWCSSGDSDLAESILFDVGNHEMSLRERFLGAPPRIAPSRVQVGKISRPVKVQSVRFAYALDLWVERTYPRVARLVGPERLLTEGDVLGGEFVVTPRIGALVTNPGSAQTHESQSYADAAASLCVSQPGASLLALARALAETAHCLAFIPAGDQVHNDLKPSDPWAWLDQFVPGRRA
jgi:hypothetical protein